MSDVFDITDAPGNAFFRDAVIDAAYELAVFAPVPAKGSWTVDALARGLDIGTGRRRLRLLLDVLVGYGVLARDGDRGDGYRTADVPQRPAPPTYKGMGWGAIAEVIRRDQPLPPSGQEGIVRMHLHLAKAGVLAADETAKLVSSRARVTPQRLVDLGGGAGAYTGAILAAYPEACATLVDFEDVVPLAKEHLAQYGARVDFVTSDIRDAKITDASVALLANVVHLHGAETCAHLCRLAASVVGSGGIVAIKDLRMDIEAGVRIGPLQSLLFALNMGIYTQDGDVHETSLLREWLAAAGLVDIEEHRLESSPNAVVVLARKP